MLQDRSNRHKIIRHVYTYKLNNNAINRLQSGIGYDRVSQSYIYTIRIDDRIYYAIKSIYANVIQMKHNKIRYYYTTTSFTLLHITLHTSSNIIHDKIRYILLVYMYCIKLTHPNHPKLSQSVDKPQS